jgi:H+/gluconate symporter-like permease
VTLNVLKWEPIVSLLIGIFSILLINFKQYKTFISSINEGAKGSVMAVINTSAAVGFGSVITAVPEFKDLWRLSTRFRL